MKLNILNVLPINKQTKKINWEYFIMNIFKYTKDQMGHRKTQEKKDKSDKTCILEKSLLQI